MAELSSLRGQVLFQNNCLCRQGPEPQKKHRYGQLLSATSLHAEAYPLDLHDYMHTGCYSPLTQGRREATLSKPLLKAQQDKKHLLFYSYIAFSTTSSWTTPEAPRS